MTVKIRIVNQADIPTWLALSQEYDDYVKALVPDLSEWYGGNDADPAYEVYMDAKIAKQEAFMAIDALGNCLGIVAVSKNNNRITFWAVSHNTDVSAVGNALLTQALAHLNNVKPIHANILCSAAPHIQKERALFHSFGFAYACDAIECGVPVNTFVKPAVKGRAQCLVIRDSKILLLKCKNEDNAHYIPGGGIELGETPEQAALCELQEECNVTGVIIRKTSEWTCPLDGSSKLYTYWTDIGEQQPSLGYDPELAPDKQLLAELRWLALDETTEIDRAYLWSAGLMSIPEFAQEVDQWAREISYPNRR